MSSDDRNVKQSKKSRKGCVNGILAIVLVCLFPWMWRGAVKLAYADRVFAAESVPPKAVAIVFGAAVYQNNRLSPILRDRMETAVQLYESGRVSKIIVSGDNREDHYNEPQAMMAYAVARGVPPEAIQPDYAGLRTYDTCYRARHIFQVETAVLVTQAFHLPRALFTCSQVGIQVVGAAADLRLYRGAQWYELRETGATLLALWDVIQGKPAAIMGDPIPVQIP